MDSALPLSERNPYTHLCHMLQVTDKQINETEERFHTVANAATIAEGWESIIKSAIHDNVCAKIANRSIYMYDLENQDHRTVIETCNNLLGKIPKPLPDIIWMMPIMGTEEEAIEFEKSQRIYAPGARTNPNKLRKTARVAKTIEVACTFGDINARVEDKMAVEDPPDFVCVISYETGRFVGLIEVALHDSEINEIENYVREAGNQLRIAFPRLAPMEDDFNDDYAEATGIPFVPQTNEEVAEAERVIKLCQVEETFPLDNVEDFVIPYMETKNKSNQISYFHSPFPFQATGTVVKDRFPSFKLISLISAGRHAMRKYSMLNDQEAAKMLGMSIMSAVDEDGFAFRWTKIDNLENIIGKGKKPKEADAKEWKTADSVFERKSRGVSPYIDIYAPEIAKQDGIATIESHFTDKEDTAFQQAVESIQYIYSTHMGRALKCIGAAANELMATYPHRPNKDMLKRDADNEKYFIKVPMSHKSDAGWFSFGYCYRYGLCGGMISSAPESKMIVVGFSEQLPDGAGDWDIWQGEVDDRKMFIMMKSTSCHPLYIAQIAQGQYVVPTVVTNLISHHVPLGTPVEAKIAEMDEEEHTILHTKMGFEFFKLMLGTKEYEATGYMYNLCHKMLINRDHGRRLMTRNNKEFKEKLEGTIACPLSDTMADAFNHTIYGRSYDTWYNENIFEEWTPDFDKRTFSRKLHVTRDEDI